MTLDRGFNSLVWCEVGIFVRWMFPCVFVRSFFIRMRLSLNGRHELFEDEKKTVKKKEKWKEKLFNCNFAVNTFITTDVGCFCLLLKYPLLPLSCSNSSVNFEIQISILLFPEFIAASHLFSFSLVKHKCSLQLLVTHKR